MVTVGLNVSQPTITVAEGESITLCAAITDPDPRLVLTSRSFLLYFIVVEIMAKSKLLLTLAVCVCVCVCACVCECDNYIYY